MRLAKSDVVDTILKWLGKANAFLKPLLVSPLQMFEKVETPSKPDRAASREHATPANATRVDARAIGRANAAALSQEQRTTHVAAKRPAARERLRYVTPLIGVAAFSMLSAGASNRIRKRRNRRGVPMEQCHE